MSELQYRDLFGTDIVVGDIMLLAKNTSAAEYSIVPYRVLGRGQRNSQEGPVPTLQLRQILLGKQWYENVDRFSPKIVELYRRRQKVPINSWTFQRGVCLTLCSEDREIPELVAFTPEWGSAYSMDTLRAAYEAAANSVEETL